MPLAVDRYLVIHNPSAHPSMSWLVIRPPTAPKRHGEVVATCPSEAWAIEACESLNNPKPVKPQGGDQQ